MDKKILIAYYSWSGNTKSVAEKIHAQTGGDIFEIVPEKPYPASYGETVDVAKKEKEENFKPALKNNIDVSKYDVIFVGTPVWWYTMAPPVKTFLSSGKFEGKIIVPFITHGGGGGYQIDKDMENIANGSVVLMPIVIYGRGSSTTENDIKNWLEKLEI